ncbi:hypothetical protein IFM89_023971 [Coptis chinensis]|uniref:Calcineurin B-like protein n=1 Tax=Coptis chinensis TaxID=261450 RepID=A0A835HP57_9MAGN|nr:hypothetical protein IFM89_023971 [Coptis chinensis]
MAKEAILMKIVGPSQRHSHDVPNVLDLFDVKRNGVIESGEFIRSLGIFHPNVHWRRKLHLKEMVLTLLIESDLALTEDVVETIMDKTFTDAYSKGDGRTNMHQMAARLLSSQTIKGGDSGGLEEDIKVDSVGLQQLGSMEQEAEKYSDLLVEVEGVVGDFTIALMLERGPRWQCALHCLIDSQILILKAGNGYHVYDVQLQQLRSLEINPKNWHVIQPLQRALFPDESTSYHMISPHYQV